MPLLTNITATSLFSTRRVFLAIVPLCLLSAVLLGDEPACAAEELRPDWPAFAVPVSNYVIEGEISFSTGDPFFFKVREGMMLTTRAEGGRAYGFVPLVQENGDVEFAVYELLPARVGEHAKEIGRFSASANGAASAAAPTAEPIDILVHGISSADFEQDAITDPSSGHPNPNELRSEFGETDCCVTCDGRLVCACEVTTRCGSCCSPACCGGGKHPRLEPSQ